ncbi:MAG TPA: GntR family transcriptional regulator [Opitutaceae bacterium]
MLPFTIQLELGLPVTEQILFAVKKAVVGGQLRPGDKFPSVRALSHELKINPNTAHKVVAALVAEGVLVTTPAVGSVVAARETGGREEKAELLGAEVERLVVEAKKLGLDQDAVLEAVANHWEKLSETGKRNLHR